MPTKVPPPGARTHDVHRYTNTDPETRDDSNDLWRFEVSVESRPLRLEYAPLWHHGQCHDSVMQRSGSVSRI